MPTQGSKRILSGLCSCAALLLLCTACQPSLADVTQPPSPSPIETADPTPEPTPEPTPHEWAGSGYSYTSEKLDITVEFPPEWAELMTISDHESWGGFLRGSPDPVDCILLRPIHGWKDCDDLDDIALIYWRLSDASGPEAEMGACAVMAERDGYELICFMRMNVKLSFEEGSVSWNECNTVEQGILNGEYEVKLLD